MSSGRCVASPVVLLAMNEKIALAMACAVGSLVLLAYIGWGEDPGQAGVGASGAAESGKPASVRAGAEELVRRGEYLVKTIGCDDCHTPWILGPRGPEPDMSRRLSGHPEGEVMPAPPASTEGPWIWHGAATNTAFAGPWGVSYAINLTPETQTGIGVWTEEIFIDTLRNGRHWGVARPILPPMPWQNYRNMTDEDLAAMFAYLQQLPPVVNRVPQAVVTPAPGSTE